MIERYGYSRFSVYLRKIVEVYGFSAVKRKVFLIVDNCTVRNYLWISGSRVQYLLTNATLFLKQMDQYVIKSFKRKYKKVLLQRVIFGLEQEESYEIDIFGTMLFSISPWNDIYDAIISNEFRHAAFI